MMKLFIANVGVNTSHVSKGLRSPIFSDKTFEFIPIPEEEERKKVLFSPRYCEIRCFNKPNLAISEYLCPERRSDIAHNDPEFNDPEFNDPEFKSFTYGDIFSPRAANLKEIQPDDLLFFLARLWLYKDGFTNESDLYFIGYFTVEKRFAPKT
ncbi:MAG: hypothetical protein QMD71_00135 [bacterium]|nr:hypothetical protein [bacterium]